MPHNITTLFATIYGSHLWSMDTPQSDFDIAEIYQVPSEIILSGASYPETLPQKKYESDNIQVEKTMWEIEHLIKYLLKGNQNAIWMTCSPLILKTCPEHAELVKIIKGNLCKNTYHSCKGMSESQISDSYKRNLGMKGLRSAWRTTNFGINLLLYNKVLFESAPEKVTLEMCKQKLMELDNAYQESSLPEFPNEEPFRQWLYKLRMNELNQKLFKLIS